MKRTHSLISASCLIVILSLGCVSIRSIYGPIDLSRANDPSLRVPVGELALAPATDIYGIRIDIWRVRSSSSSGGSNSVEYSPIGVSLGQGLFIDANNNICVDILAYFGITDESFAYDQRVSMGRIGNLQTLNLVERNGNSLLRTANAGITKLKWETKTEGDSIVRQSPMFSQKIEKTANGYSMVEKVQFFTFSGLIETAGEDRVDFDPIPSYGKGTYVREGPDRVTFGKTLAIERLPDRIRFTANRHIQWKGVQDFIPAKDGFFIVNEKAGLVTEVRREGNDFLIFVNGKLGGDYRRMK